MTVDKLGGQNIQSAKQTNAISPYDTRLSLIRMVWGAFEKCFQNTFAQHVCYLAKSVICFMLCNMFYVVWKFNILNFSLFSILVICKPFKMFLLNEFSWRVSWYLVVGFVVSRQSIKPHEELSSLRLRPFICLRWFLTMPK